MDYRNSSQNLALALTATLPGSLVESQILKPPPHVLTQKSGGGPSNLCLISPPGDVDVPE